MTNQAQKPPKETPLDIAICCPICKEGRSWNRKSRLHLYKKGSMSSSAVHCFNCGWKGNMGKYLQEVDPTLYHNYRNEKKNNDFNNIDFNTILKRTEIKDKVKSKDNLKIMNINDFDFIEITKSKKGMRYLYNRGIPTKNFKHFYYVESTEVKLDDKSYSLDNGVIVPLWYDSNLKQIYGFQYRSIDKKQFLTFIPQENSGYKCYNFFESNRDKVYVFESVFDLMSVDIPLENKISSLGSDLPEIVFDEFDEIILTYDNTITDETARNKIIKIIKNKKDVKVFLWLKSMKGFKDFNEILKNAMSKGYKDTPKKLKRVIESNIYSGVDALSRLYLK